MKGHLPKLGSFQAAALALLAFPPPALAQSRTAPAETVETIIVTAEKRSERLNLVPAAVSVLEGSELQAEGISSVADFAALTPGLTFSGGGSGATDLFVRGVNTGGLEDASTVGVVIDGVPYGSSTSFAEGAVVSLDSSLWDLNRIEVLRGPQGTLYGANGMAGLLSYVYNQPDLTAFGAGGEATLSGTEDGSANYALRGVANVPLIPEKLGLRLAGSHEYDSGYIDYTALGDEGTNRDIANNARGILLFEPISRLTVTVEGLYQRTSRAASDYATYDRVTGRPVGGSLDNILGLLDPQSFNYAEAALTIDYGLGWANLTSITGYQRNEANFDEDYTNTILGTALKALGVAQSRVNIVPITRKVTQELRLASSDTGPVEYLAGFFYTGERSTNTQSIEGLLPNGQPDSAVNPILSVYQPSRYDEYAFFGQATYAMSSRVHVIGGFRYSSDSLAYMDTNGGLLHGLVPNVPLTTHGEAEENYLAAAFYKLTDSANVYARAASGYRPGGPNPNVPGAPGSFSPDKLWNYEAGYKGTLFDGRIDVQLDGFYVTWSDIQVTAATPGGFSYVTNGRNAVSRGFEGEGTFVPFPGMILRASLDYTNAFLLDALPQVGGSAGERLPNSPVWSGALMGEYHVPFWTAWEGFVGGTLRAVGERTSAFNGAPALPQFPLGGYAMIDLRAGIESGTWALTAYVHNLGNSRAELSAVTETQTATNLAEVEIARPRTLGVQLDAHL